MATDVGIALKMGRGGLDHQLKHHLGGKLDLPIAMTCFPTETLLALWATALNSTHS